MRNREDVKARVPLAGPSKTPKKKQDQINSLAIEIGSACRLHEDFKPLRWQGRADYLKALYDPDP